MRVAIHIIDHLGIGGAQRIIEGILKKRPQDKVLFLNPFKPLAVQIPYKQIISPSITNPILVFWKALTLLPFIKGNYQVVHCHLKVSWIYAIIICIVFRGHNNIKFVFHEHDPEIMNHIWYKLLLKMAIKFGIVVTVTDFIRNLLLLYGIPPKKVITLRNFVDTDKFSPRPPQPLQPSDRKIVVGFVGRLIKRKGWEDLIVLAGILKNREIIFKVIGIGEDAALFQQSIREKRLGGVFLIEGPTSNVPIILQSVDILVMPSSLESSGLVHLEAQASGIPVIAYDIPGVNEMISKENSILVPLGQVDLMAKRILEIIQSQNFYNHLIKKGFENAGKHSLDSYVLKLEKIYSDQLPLD